MKSLLSVIVPVYNTAALLPRCVNSLLAQTCGDIEIILVDDGSPDGAGRVCDEYAASVDRITVIHQENRGVSAARNAGLAAARGRFIGFVDSDDWIQPEMYAALLAALTRHGTQVAACGYAIHRYDGAVFDNKVDPALPPLLERERALESLIHPSGIQGFLCNKLFDRALLTQAGGGSLLRLDERISICEDLLFVSRCVEISGRIAYDPRPLYVYCVQDYGGPGNYHREKRTSELIALEQLVESWKNISPALGAYMKRKYTNASLHILHEATLANDSEYLPILRRHLQRHLGSYLRSSVPNGRKARVLLALALPQLMGRIWKAAQKKKALKAEG